MTQKVDSGWAFHVHHTILFEFCINLKERQDYIKANKPRRQIPIRLHLLKIIPQRYLPEQLIEAGDAYNEAWEVYNEAEKARNEAWKAFYKAEKAYYEAKKACKPAMIELHDKLCPDCPWDGNTIFPEKESKSKIIKKGKEINKREE